MYLNVIIFGIDISVGSICSYVVDLAWTGLNLLPVADQSRPTENIEAWPEAEVCHPGELQLAPAQSLGCYARQYSRPVKTNPVCHQINQQLNLGAAI